MHTAFDLDEPGTLSLPYVGRPCTCSRCGRRHRLVREGSDFVIACGGDLVVVARRGWFLPSRRSGSSREPGSA